jgi:hypothetical protein
MLLLIGDNVYRGNSINSYIVGDKVACKLRVPLCYVTCRLGKERECHEIQKTDTTVINPGRM